MYIHVYTAYSDTMTLSLRLIIQFILEWPQNDHDMTFNWPFLLELGTVDIYMGADSQMKISDFWPWSKLAKFISDFEQFLEFRVIFSKSLLSSIILRLKTELDMSESDYNWDASTSLEFWERFLRCIMTLVEEDQVWHIRLS